MNTERRNEVDGIIQPLTSEFKENASFGDGKFGIFYMSCDKNTMQYSLSLEANRETFKEMILTLMQNEPLVAEDIIDVVENHYVKENIITNRLRMIAGPIKE